MKILEKIALTNLTNFGSKARKDIRPDVLIGEKKSFRRGDILDANAIEQLVDVMVRNGGSTEELEGVLNEIRDYIKNLEDKLDNITVSVGDNLNTKLIDILVSLEDLDFHNIDDLFKHAEENLANVASKMEECCANVSLTIDLLKVLVTQRDPQIISIIQNLDQKLTLYLEMVIDGQVIILGPSEIILGDSFTYFTVGVTDKGLEVLDNYDGVFSIVSEVPTYNAGTEDVPDIRPVVTISDHGVLNTVDVDIPTFTVSVKIEYDFGDAGIATSISNVLVKNLGAPSAEDMRIVGSTEDPIYAEKPYQISELGNTFTLEYIGEDRDAINWDNVYFSWRVTGNITGTYEYKDEETGEKEERHYIEIVERTSDHIIIKNLVGTTGYKSGDIIVECYTRNSDRFLFTVSYGIELYDPDVLMTINSNYEVFVILASVGIIPEHNGQRDYITYKEAADTSIYRFSNGYTNTNSYDYSYFSHSNSKDPIQIKHFDEMQYFGISSSSYYNIVYCLFAGCTELESITLPPNINIIGESAFSGCSALKEICIPYMTTITYPNKGAVITRTFSTGVTQIFKYAFNGCTSLYKVLNGKYLNRIHADAFNGCLQFYEHWDEKDEDGNYVVVFEPTQFIMKSVVNDSSTTRLRFVDEDGRTLEVSTKSTNVFAYKNNYNGRFDYNAVTNAGGMLFSTEEPYIPLGNITRPENGVDAPLQPSFAITKVDPETGEEITVYIRRDVFGFFKEALETKPDILFTYYLYTRKNKIGLTEYTRQLSIDDLEYHLCVNSSSSTDRWSYVLYATYQDVVADDMEKFPTNPSSVQFVNVPEGFTTTKKNCNLSATWSDEYKVNYTNSIAYYPECEVYMLRGDGKYYIPSTFTPSYNVDMADVEYIVVMNKFKTIVIPKEYQGLQSTSWISGPFEGNVVTYGDDSMGTFIYTDVNAKGDNDFTSTYIYDYTDFNTVDMDGYKNTTVAINNELGIVFPWAIPFSGWRGGAFKKDYYLPSIGEMIMLTQAVLNLPVNSLANYILFPSGNYGNLYTFVSTMINRNKSDGERMMTFSTRSSDYFTVTGISDYSTYKYTFLALENKQLNPAEVKANVVIPTEASKNFPYGAVETKTGSLSSGSYYYLVIPKEKSTPFRNRHLFSLAQTWGDDVWNIPLCVYSSSWSIGFFGGINDDGNLEVLAIEYPSGELKFVEVPDATYDSSTKKYTALGISAPLVTSKQSLYKKNGESVNYVCIWGKDTKEDIYEATLASFGKRWVADTQGCNRYNGDQCATNVKEYYYYLSFIDGAILDDYNK